MRVWFHQRLTVDVNRLPAEFKTIARQADDAFDEIALRLFRVLEHDDIAPGDLTVKQVDVSIDFGASWQRANLGDPKNKYDWQRWTANVKLPSDGYFEVWARGTDSNGAMQPHQAGFWNPQGYGGNAMHRIAVLVG